MITDFTGYKFRASSLGTLMTGLGKPKLSVTTQTELKKLHRQEVFGKRTDIRSKYLDKGIQCEELSITLYSEVKNQFIVNNKTRKENEFLSGECDNAQKIIREFKTSWDLSTFPMYDKEVKNKDYYWQCQSYMELWDLDEAELIYCLVNTPEGLIIRETYYMENKLGFADVGLPDELQKEIINNMTFDDIPKEFRVKVFKIPRDKEAMRQAEKQIEMCRLYLNELSVLLAGELVTSF